MLCPEVWTFDSPSFNATEMVQKEWNEVARKKLFAKVDRVYEMVTVVLPNCKEEDQEPLKALIQKQGLCYTVHALSLQELISPVFIEAFIKRGEFSAISIGKHPESECIVCLSPGGKLTLSLDKEVFQSVRLEGKPVQSSRKIVDKYLCSIDLLDENLLRTTRHREILHEALGSDLLPKVSLKFKWAPTTEEICDSSAAKYFSDQGYEVVESPAVVNLNEELSQRMASFADLTTGDCTEMLEHVGMLALGCSQTTDEYLNSYSYSGEMVRVKNSLIVTARGFYQRTDVQEILDAIISTMHKDTPWIAMNALGFTRTPSCERFYEEFYDVSSERSLTFLMNSQKQHLVQQILPIVKKFSK